MDFPLWPKPSKAAAIGRRCAWPYSKRCWNTALGELVSILQLCEVEREAKTNQVLNKTFWIAGFECSCHRRSDGRRLDLVAATRHDHFAQPDYSRLRQVG